ncbi:MAG: glycoside hydrolase family 88 protein [Bacteroidales bacterium]|nr:glycoside hydrolase family 88 protein [Bacteroidales bacterium]
MRKLIVILITLVPLLAGCSESMDELAERVFDLAREQYEAMDTTLGEGELPRTFQGDTLLTSTSAWWGSGFYPGSLWYIYYYTGDSGVKALAEKYTERLYKESLKARSHDIGFMINCSYGNALRITGESKYAAPMQTAAIELAKRFNSKVGCTRSWNFSPKGKNVTWEFPVIIDNMMNLELLEEAYKLTGTDSLDVIARTHANTTILNHFREDYSSFHVVDYDPLDGHVRMKMTHQGYSDDSAWARGQAWGLYGFTMMYRETDDSTYLAQAEKIAAMLLQRLPEDGIPYWDFDAPEIPNELRDASAAAIMASALTELAGYTASAEKAAAYKAMAEKQVRTLAGRKYLAKEGDNGHFLLKHSVGNHPGDSEMDVPLTYADYYFLEAILKLTDRL